jgi:hypothetical protein
MERPDERFLAQVRRLRRGARRDLVLRRVVQGLFFGCLPGAVIALLGGTLRLPVPAALAAVTAVGIGAAAGAAAGLARRLDTRLLLLRADRALASRELASAAWDIAISSDGSAGGLFADAIFEDAGRLLADSAPRRLLGKLHLPFLPFIPLLAALILLASLFPVDLAGLFPGPAPASREMAALGEELEGVGRRLGAAAREQGSGRGLELARELERLGRELQERSIERDEALERVESLRRGLAEEYSLRLRRYPSDGARQRVGGEEAGGSKAQSGEDASSKGLPSAGEGSRPASEDAEELADAMNGLNELADRASGQASREPDPSRLGRGGGPAGSGEQGKTNEGAGNEAEGEGRGAGSEGEGDSAASRQPGTTPVPDRKGPSTSIVANPQGKPLQADSAAEGEGEAMQLLVRSLPAWSRARAPAEAVIRDYQRRAESALAREEVPVELMPYVKSYFLSIGMGAGGQ